MTRTYPGWSGLMVVAKASRTGTGRDHPRCAVTGKWRYSPPPPCYRLGYCTASRRPFDREELRAEISLL